jgi:hypothetical protein
MPNDGTPTAMLPRPKVNVRRSMIDIMSQSYAAGMIFFDMAEPSQIIEAVEPVFLSLNATTELVSVMNADDLRKGLAKVAGK